MNPRCSYLPYRKTGRFQAIVNDYLDRDPFLEPFLGNLPTLNDFEGFIQRRQDYPVNRSLLAEVLRRQYAATGITGQDTLRQIDRLSESNTFTITTGQQTGIFLGPLYATLKILSAVKLCRQLITKYPQYHFVPVFWMATEDHDVEEIRHVWVEGKKLSWETDQTGPVGRFSTTGMDEVIRLYREIAGKNPDGVRLAELFERAYTLDSLAKATRLIVHELFGQYGVVVADADDARLKLVFKDIIYTDITEQRSHAAVEHTRKQLEARYLSQVNGREINFFYLLNDYRERIVKTSTGFSTHDGQYAWTTDALKQEVASRPEFFSPNVLMRPLYQEAILPNIAYIGGGAEVAYWAELKSCFNNYGVPFPAVLLRNSALVLDAVNTHRMRNAGLEAGDLFGDRHELEKQLVVQSTGIDPEWKLQQEQVKQLAGSLIELAGQSDPTLVAAGEATQKRLAAEVERFGKKLVRNLKKRESEQINRLHALLEHAFPGGTLQERKENIATLMLRHGYGIIDELLEGMDPLDNRFLILSAG